MKQLENYQIGTIIVIVGPIIIGSITSLLLEMLSSIEMLVLPTAILSIIVFGLIAGYIVTEDINKTIKLTAKILYLIGIILSAILAIITAQGSGFFRNVPFLVFIVMLIIISLVITIYLGITWLTMNIGKIFSRKSKSKQTKIDWQNQY
jgi:hypothetical protein